MGSINFSLLIQSRSAAKLARLWLLVGLSALLLAGLFALLLVLSRTPGIQAVFPLIDFFKVALIIHVDLSVLIWFLAFEAVLWCFLIRKPKPWDKLSVLLSFLGMLLLVVSPFVGGGEPLMNNYVPIFKHDWFFYGLLCFALGVSGLLFSALLSGSFGFALGNSQDLIRFVLYISAVSAVIAFAAFAATYFSVAKTLADTVYFETLFWSSGHSIQFTHTVLMLMAWAILASASGVIPLFSIRSAAVCFLIALLPVLLVPVLMLSYEIAPGKHFHVFLQLMRFGGLSSIPIGALIVWSLFKSAKLQHSHRHLRSVLWWSIILFATGGVLGFMIQGVNVVIPAHYHGSIVGVTLAFMGVTYYLLPKLGYAEPNAKWANIQPYLYGGGQLLHILGLAWSGGYGVQRKTAGAAQGLDRLPEVLGMGMMGLGGLISIIGGLVFLLVAFAAIKRSRQSSPSL